MAKTTKPSSGLTSKQKSSTVKAAERGADLGKPGKGFAKVEAKAAKEYGSKEAGKSSCRRNVEGPQKRKMMPHCERHQCDLVEEPVNEMTTAFFCTMCRLEAQEWKRKEPE